MSQSPEKIDESTTHEEVDRFSQSYDQLRRLLSSGRSFSGGERNCAYLNTGHPTQPRFANISHVSGIDYADDGRGMATTDWDFDGDLDFWISNRTGPRVRFLRNDVESTNGFLSIRLQGNGTTCNRDGIGTRVEVHLHDQTLLRTLTAGEGFLTQSSKWLHFGLGTVDTIDSVHVRWPDGKQQTFSDVEPNRFYEIAQGNDVLLSWTPPDRKLSFEPTVVKSRPKTEKMRLALCTETPLPRLAFRDLKGEVRQVRQFLDKPLLLNIWASWCGPCLAELKEFQANDVHVLALSVDGINNDSPTTYDDARKAVSANDFQFAVGFANTRLIRLLEAYADSLFKQYRPLPIPTSFLINMDATVSVIYKGSLDANQLTDDMGHLNDLPQDRMQRSLPFRGRWLTTPSVFYRTNFVGYLVEEEMLEEACDYVKHFFAVGHMLPGEGEVLSQLTQQLRLKNMHDLAEQLESDPRLQGLTRPF